MTQDQYGQARGAGYGAGGDVVDTEDDPSDQDMPMTRFQKVASALRGDKPARDEEGQTDPAEENPDMTADTGARPDEAGAQRDDYWEVPDRRADQVAAVTSPDAPAAEAAGQDETRPDLPGAQDPASTQRDLYEPDRVGGNGLAGDTGPGDTVAEGTVPGDTVPGDTAAGDSVAEDVTGDLRPGEGEDALDDLGDLAYGKLLPDATVFTEQWQQIQYRFVDDPQASVTEAAEVIAQVTAKLEAAIQERLQAIEARQRAIQERQRSLRGRWSEGTQADTETLRETLRMYRAFLDQLIGPKA